MTTGFDFFNGIEDELLGRYVLLVLHGEAGNVSPWPGDALYRDPYKVCYPTLAGFWA